MNFVVNEEQCVRNDEKQKDRKKVQKLSRAVLKMIY